MTARHRRCTRTQVGFANLAALVMLANAAIVGQYAYHSPAMAAWLTATVLGYTAAALVVVAGCWTASYTWHAGRTRHDRRQPRTDFPETAAPSDAGGGADTAASRAADDTQLMPVITPRLYAPQAVAPEPQRARSRR